MPREALAYREHEPGTPYQPEADPWNVMLDQFEAQVRLLVDHGLEPQVRARLDRLLAPVQPRTPETQQRSVDDLLQLTQVIEACKTLQRFKLTADQHAAIGTLREWARAQLPAGRPR